MKALSLWQPWASLIAVGAKQIETRSWSTPYRGPLLIHAAKKWDKENESFAVRRVFRDALQAGGIEPAAERADRCRPWLMPLGAVVAAVRLVDCLRIPRGLSLWPVGVPEDGSVTLPPDEPERSFGDYAPGRYVWILADVVRPAAPIPFRGCQGVYDPQTNKPTDEQLARLAELWAAVAAGKGAGHGLH